MKRFLFGAAAAAALVAPAVASAETNAVVGLQYTNVDFDVADFDNYGITGAFSHDFDGGGVLQMDGEAGRNDIGGGGCCIGMSYGAVHYGMRNDGYGFAGFLTFEDFFGISGVGVGVEGQWFFSSAVLNGSVGYMDFGDFDVTATNVGLDGAWFFTPNFALTGMADYGQIDVGGGGDADATVLGIGGEWRFDNSPASISLGYRNADADGFETDTWTIALNIDLGTDSLQDRARSGPSFSGARMIHDTLKSALLP